jgi:hypothetical protein
MSRHRDCSTSFLTDDRVKGRPWLAQIFESSFQTKGVQMAVFGGSEAIGTVNSPSERFRAALRGGEMTGMGAEQPTWCIIKKFAPRQHMATPHGRQQRHDCGSPSFFYVGLSFIPEVARFFWNEEARRWSAPPDYGCTLRS